LSLFDETEANGSYFFLLELNLPIEQAIEHLHLIHRFVDTVLRLVFFSQHVLPLSSIGIVIALILLILDNKQLFRINSTLSELIN
jgi:hypothetical protein